MKLATTKLESGFTIVELMIALSVLSVILTISTVILIQLGVLYSKGVNSANLQNNTRNVINDLSTSLQFSGNIPAGCNSLPTTCYMASSLVTSPPSNVTAYAYCIGNIRYSYVLGREMGTDLTTQIPHVLWRDQIADTSNCQPLKNLSQQGTISDSNSVANSGFDMLASKMRLDKFSVVESPSGSGNYYIDVWTAFGDDDLLSFLDGSGNPVAYSASTGHAICNSGSGDQYCAISELSSANNLRLVN